jgi:SAM-dependent methyltransferase
MNKLTFPRENEFKDTHHPKPEFWGPVKLYRGTELVDAAAPPDSIATLAWITCPICSVGGSTAVAIVYGFPVYECGTCGVGFVSPQPPEEVLRRFYDSAYWDNWLGDARRIYERRDLSAHILRRQAEFLDRLLVDHGKSILDIGTGDGSMLRALRDMGYRNMVGLEPDAKNAERASTFSGAPVLPKTIAEMKGTKWDCITMWAVIEHLSDPLAACKAAVDLLVKGGTLAIMTGDNASLAAKLQGCFDMWMYPPEHLFYFTSRSLKTCLRRAGLDQVRCRIGFQNATKETALYLMRLTSSLNAMRHSRTRPRWRSSCSNLLVAWGYKQQ